MGHEGVSRKSPNDAPWEMLSQGLGRPISAPLLTVALKNKPAPKYTDRQTDRHETQTESHHLGKTTMTFLGNASHDACRMSNSSTLQSHPG